MQIRVGLTTGTRFDASIFVQHGGFITLNCGERGEVSILISTLDDAERMVAEINRAVAELRAALAKEGA